MDERLGHFRAQSDGTYLNPILPADFQNTDVLRVGKHYYYISATKAMSPGMAVLMSDDMLDWKIIGHVIPDISQFSPRFLYPRIEGASGRVRLPTTRANSTFISPHLTKASL
jgi:beta-xylosidase